jgi:hypothetical protein
VPPEAVACGNHRAFSGSSVSVRFGNASYAGKTSNEALLSYSSAGGLCKEGLERVLGEAAAGERARRSDPSGELLPLLPRALRLRDEPPDRVADRVGPHPLPFQVGTDPLVAVAAPGELLGSRAREAPVVDVSGLLERLERLRLRLRGDACPFELRAQRGGGVVPPRERPDRAVQRLLTLATARR